MPFRSIFELFDRVECWYELYNSDTNIIVADTQTQKVAFAIWQNLARHIIAVTAVDVASFVPRTMQRRFHVALACVRYGPPDSMHDLSDGIVPGHLYRMQDHIKSIFEAIYITIENLNEILFGNYDPSTEVVQVQNLDSPRPRQYLLEIGEG